MNGGFFSAHDIFHMTQSGALCQGQPSSLGIVQFQMNMRRQLSLSAMVAGFLAFPVSDVLSQPVSQPAVDQVYDQTRQVMSKAC
jgi:hypothetical protein